MTKRLFEGIALDNKSNHPLLRSHYGERREYFVGDIPGSEGHPSAKAMVSRPQVVLDTGRENVAQGITFNFRGEKNE